jgi:Fe-S-cluster-containing dehydrogenase component
MGGGVEMARYGMLINIDRCNGCYNCFLACRDEYEGNDYLPYSAAQPAEGKSWMRVTEKERGSTPKVKVDYIPVPCLHCADAPCVNKAADGSVYRRPDGIVIIDPEKAKGKKETVANCPHRVIHWNEEKNLPQKCTFCAHLLDAGWKEPRCVEACPDDAIVFGDLDDPTSEISRLMASFKTEELNPDFGLKPNVRYVDLPKRFIAGEVVLTDKEGECAIGVKVELLDGASTVECRTDAFGDFEFDGLKASAKYTLRVAHEGYGPVEKSVITYSDLNVGAIELAPLAG